MKLNEARKALFVGINNYPDAPLRACIRDAERMHQLLAKHGDESPNFFGPKKTDLSTQRLQDALVELLNPTRPAKHALFYYSGHGYADDSGSGYFVASDYSKDKPGIPMWWLFDKLNKSTIPEITVILDCCFAGNFGSELSLRENISVLAATRGNDVSVEGRLHGMFTEVLIKGLEGAAADVFGNVTATSLYNLADTTFLPTQQRPVYRGHLAQVTALRKCEGGLEVTELRQLCAPRFFRDPETPLGLRPHDVPTDFNAQTEKARFWRQLARFEKARLVECSHGQSLVEAAKSGSEVQLSVTGKFYCELIKKGKL